MKNKNNLHFLAKRLEIQVVFSLFLAVIVGLVLPKLTLGIYELYGIQIGNFIPSISWIGDTFMNLLKMFLGPLLFFSVIVAILGLGDIKRLGSIGARTMLYYMLTTILAISVSLFIMNIFKPGEGLDLGISDGFNSAGVEALTFSSFMQGLIPSNIFVSFVEFNAMQIVISSIILGIAILSVDKKEESKKLKDFFDTINSGILKFISFVIKLTPLGVFAIVTNIIYENGIESIINLLPFVLVILIALAIHALIVLPSIGYLIGKFNPFLYFKNVKQAILVGFSTSSSSATMGVSMNVAKNEAMLSKEVVDFTFPIGTTINMDGTALYQAGVALFIAQVLGVDISIVGQITMVLIVILASIGAAGIPGAGILILTTVFLTIGLPIEAIGLILAIDRILDMFRTSVNVWGDLITAKVIDRFYKMDLLKKSERKKLFDKAELVPNVVYEKSE